MQNGRKGTLGSRKFSQSPSDLVKPMQGCWQWGENFGLEF